MEVDSYPRGYPEFAAWANSDQNFTVYRRFGTLRSRLILHRQFELATLEKKLLELDKRDEQTNRYRITSLKDDRNDHKSARTVLIDDIDRRLEHYGELQSLQLLVE